MKKKHAQLAFASGALLFCSLNANAIHLNLAADFVDRGTIVDPDSDLFGFVNESDPGIQVASMTIDISTADDNSDEFVPPGDHIPVFNTLDGCSPDYCYGAELGFPVDGVAPGAGNTGFVDFTAAEQAAAEESQLLTLNFTDFDPGETFFLTTDLDDTFDFRVSGREFALSTLTVTFVGPGLPAGGETLTSEFKGDPNDFWRAVTRVEGDVAPIPVPAAVWLFVSAIAGLGFVRRRRRV